MISMTVNGAPCNPSACIIASPGAWSFSGSAFATGNVVDTTWSLQSIAPAGAGGSVTVITTAGANAASISTVIGGVDRGGSAHGSAAVVNGNVVETLQLAVGPNGTTGGDFQGIWVAVEPPTPPTPPTPPAPPQPPTCTTCTPPPVTPPPVLVPTLSTESLFLLAAVVIACASVLRKKGLL